ncbi:hypothetical protein C8A00DRAFT_10802 [Chaetomidium leptoderma]|uniref:Uncharacterized protein n=1 Tax=Chaetomidium leptoderma TaxID=669021 RepID=A0AAN7A1C4_9PEZI|nr:hypothetical protein C8A00DRAFT_10802 [Chaetomidium leptoderma]
MLSRTNTFPATGKRVGRFWRRRLRSRRAHTFYPPGNGEVTGTSEPALSTLPKRGQPLEFPIAFEAAFQCKLERRERNGRAVLDFDGLEAYNVSSKVEHELRLDEARRLLAVARDPTTPVCLGSSGVLEAMKGDEAGYQALSRMSATISTALNLCLLDNECLNLEFCPQIASRDRLQKMIRRAQVAANRRGLKDTKLDMAHMKAVFALVDYISAVIARLVSQTASGDFWITNVMSVLAARIAKIKFLLVDITACAAVAADTGEETLEAFPGDGHRSTEAEEEEECEEALRLIDANTKEGLTSEEDAAVGSYCISQNKYRSGINAALKYILLSLRLLNRSGLLPTTYEMCVVVYEIGYEGFKTVLFQDRDLEYSASSDRDVLNTAQPAFIMLDQVLKELDKRPPPPAEGGKEHHPSLQAQGCDDATATYVEWAYKGRDASQTTPAGGGVDYIELSKLRNVPLFSMADITAAMVPLIATSPILLSGFTNFRTVIALAGSVKDVVTPFEEGQFGAFCRLYTSSFKQEAEKRQVLRLSKAFADQRFSRCRLLTQKGEGKWGAGFWSRHGHDASPSAVIQERLRDCSADMKDWIVDENSVTISARFYVSSVMLGAILLGLGGLAIGFTVGERIEGVDPFNLASYAWILAAFVILICRSVLVEHWTWSDFLRWRVRCRSVSELAATTGVDKQLLLAKLLHDDCGGSILTTRGPYNSMFRRRAGDGTTGFSIDRPISAETLMLSGLAPLKVVTPRGDAIVLLDYRQGTSLTVVEHEGIEDKDRELLICDDLTPIAAGGKPSRSWHGLDPVGLRLTRKNQFKWRRVQGLYDFKGVDVVFQ